MLERNRSRLQELLKTRSLMFGDFVLASGRRSPYYFDSKKTTLTSDGALLTALEFLAVIRAGSLSRAATALGLTQPTVGRRLDRLEDACGVQLVRRTTRRIR